MRDTLEQRLAARLHDVGETVPDDLEAPADLEQRVGRVRNRRGVRRFAALSAAALVAVALATVAIVGRTQEPNRVDVNGRPGGPDPLPAGTAMLDSRAEFVVAVGADGGQVATLVHANRGTIIDAQLTDDHRWLWYLSVPKTKKAGSACGEVVRADVTRGTSAIVARAASFAISPDGTRLALAGGGDGSTGEKCTPLTDAMARARVVVTDLATEARSTWVDEAVPRVHVFNQMRWSNDGRQIVTRICGDSCEPLVTFDVPAELGPPLLSNIIDQSGFLGVRPSAAFGPDGRLFVLERNVTERWKDHAQSVVVFDAATLQQPTTLLTVDWQWDLKEVVPTEAGLFVVGKPRNEAGETTGPTGLYRVDGGNLVFVKDFEFGVLTPVFSRP